MIKNGIFLFILAFFILAVFVPSYTDLQDMKARNVDLEGQIVVLQEKNRKLAQEKILLEDDPIYLERVGREKLGIVRDGEMVLKLRMEDLE